ncbi:hypothetical protein ANOM_000506 [Aspergillus nomiae NRRL 13137]|uniref:Uncharacterized protein n=1 Tax=Aspergillus nomiae NRRL (strain ATCC 15546 / NRRL 13137 / CBS 260.88 / M93) TaxID=1509407 RepID=A0A0L1JHT0_ASPN3|nr:uncharacterized protein ANOM_000506 [Aspergillus nomiae NRRL 13137]KNG91335.1 hypothetical protein ANOM_000506 [Aspergillus nomiae NRRL 13137]
MHSVILLTLLFLGSSVAVQPTYPNRKLPPLRGDPQNGVDPMYMIETGYCKMGGNAGQCRVDRRRKKGNLRRKCDTDKPCTKDDDPCSIRWGPGDEQKPSVINVNCHLY